MDVDEVRPRRGEVVEDEGVDRGEGRRGDVGVEGAEGGAGGGGEGEGVGFGGGEVVGGWVMGWGLGGGR